ncbi:unnamed protein product [Rangifer tarandus platyrhynchus]|uniref:Uncharacterized protein n=1 Tax=Rangifer tarandus platyrhynchus TaxID=3082113 RepID=A0ABN8XLY1_RANTA|nr:unnamed protein product [Rangifer tarandus platyrhynchus]
MRRSGADFSLKPTVIGANDTACHTCASSAEISADTRSAAGVAPCSAAAIARTASGDCTAVAATVLLLQLLLLLPRPALLLLMLLVALQLLQLLLQAVSPLLLVLVATVLLLLCCCRCFSFYCSCFCWRYCSRGLPSFGSHAAPAPDSTTNDDDDCFVVNASAAHAFRAAAGAGAAGAGTPGRSVALTGGSSGFSSTSGEQPLEEERPQEGRVPPLGGGEEEDEALPQGFVSDTIAEEAMRLALENMRLEQQITSAFSDLVDALPSSGTTWSTIVQRARCAIKRFVLWRTFCETVIRAVVCAPALPLPPREVHELIDLACNFRAPVALRCRAVLRVAFTALIERFLLAGLLSRNCSVMRETMVRYLKDTSRIQRYMRYGAAIRGMLARRRFLHNLRELEIRGCLTSSTDIQALSPDGAGPSAGVPGDAGPSCSTTSGSPAEQGTEASSSSDADAAAAGEEAWKRLDERTDKQSERTEDVLVMAVRSSLGAALSYCCGNGAESAVDASIDCSAAVGRGQAYCFQFPGERVFTVKRRLGGSCRSAVQAYSTRLNQLLWDARVMGMTEELDRLFAAMFCEPRFAHQLLEGRQLPLIPSRVCRPLGAGEDAVADSPGDSPAPCQPPCPAPLKFCGRRPSRSSSSSSSVARKAPKRVRSSGATTGAAAAAPSFLHCPQQLGHKTDRAAPSAALGAPVDSSVESADDNAADANADHTAGPPPHLLGVSVRTAEQVSSSSIISTATCSNSSSRNGSETRRNSVVGHLHVRQSHQHMRQAVHEHTPEVCPHTVEACQHSLVACQPGPGVQ